MNNNIDGRLVPGSATVSAIESLWRDIQSHHPEVPDVCVSLGFVKNVYGCVRGWHLIVSFVAVKEGAECVVGTVLHEAAHLGLRAKGAGHWGTHGRAFSKACESFGLVDHDLHRFGTIDIGPAAYERYRAHIHRLGILLGGDSEGQEAASVIA